MNDRYRPQDLDLILAEAAYLVRTLGGTGARHHVVLIGGLAPSLLVPSPLPDDPHMGTTDIDICLDVALTSGDTEEYERIEQLIKSIGYAQGESSFKWHRSGLVPITLEFFCPAGEDVEAGRMFRPRARDQPTAKHNLGSSLSALALAAGRALTNDVVEYEWEGRLPDDKGIASVTLRVTGIAGFLAAKATALDVRDKPKDAYDIVWLLDNWPGGPAAAAAAFAERPVARYDEVTAAIALLPKFFETAEHRGSKMYGELWTQINQPGNTDEALARARRAVLVIDEFARTLEDVGFG